MFLIRSYPITYVVVFLCVLMLQVRAQQPSRIYGNAFSVSVGAGALVIHPEYAIGAEAAMDNYTTLRPALIGAGSAEIVVKFLQVMAPIPAVVPLYIYLVSEATNIPGSRVYYSFNEGASENGNGLAVSVVGWASSDRWLRLSAARAYNAIQIRVSGGTVLNRDKHLYRVYFQPIDVPLVFKETVIETCEAYNVLDNLEHLFTQELRYELLDSDGEKLPDTWVTESGQYRLLARDKQAPEEFMVESSPFSVIVNPTPGRVYLTVQQIIN